METNFQVEGDGDPEDNGRKSKKEKKKKKEKDKEKVGTANKQHTQFAFEGNKTLLASIASKHQRVKVADGRFTYHSDVLLYSLGRQLVPTVL